MSSALEQLPPPKAVQPLKVIGLGASRTGTIGLFQSLKLIGYRPFHITELLPHGTKELHALCDAMVASETTQPWSREDFNKLFGDYDCLVECPCYFGTAGLELFLADPDIKFILTTRSPESFSKSLSGTLGTYYAKLGRWPLSAARYCDEFVRELERMFGLMWNRWSDGLPPNHPDARAALEKNLKIYEDKVKALVPPERLLILDLEKGFGFKEICQFLDKPIPDDEYPRSNALAEFNAAAEYILAPATRKVKLITSAVTVGISAIVLGFVFHKNWVFSRR
ncbi:hypothetical protein DHEL01_v203239 [Diaporthe helianthi]|uniref:NAD dependent epimerase/dehydratase n=1 Tax=Diaporthe helianthi TaxID=158607 RepID=A0A2P5I778_DIAHE|nr:hypothetical protein DHEL01_v203239 [Diaporthe helianthi]